jgi:3-hydroxyacyl-[acyl-carrier-protein] dehydratase
VTGEDGFERRFTVDDGHPALSGHFPGEPVLPGVVLLEEAIDAAEEWLGPGLAVVGVPQVKFMAPLGPGDEATMSLRRETGRLHFRVVRGETVVAAGVIELSPERDGT